MPPPPLVNLESLGFVVRAVECFAFVLPVAAVPFYLLNFC